jgi:hypothetical protein
MNTALRLFRVLTLLASSSIALYSYSLSQWSSDPKVNTGICTESHSQAQPAIVCDGTGGVIIVWIDSRNGTDYDIYAQRVSAGGSMLWPVDGVPVSTATGDQMSPRLVNDGLGGAIVTWYDRRGGGNEVDVYAQRLDGSGLQQWPAEGVAVSTAGKFQLFPNIVSDCTGGAIIAWDDYRNGTSGYNIFAQRIDASGMQRWDSNDVLISSEVINQGLPQIVSDLAGGAIIVWNADSGGTHSDIYARRIDSLGTILWDSTSVPICTAPNVQKFPMSVSDSAGGSIITWMDFRSGNLDIYAQRITIEGVVLWDTNGVAISTSAGNQTSPMLTSDGAQGAVITWQDADGNSQSGIYVQRIDASGNVQWNMNGILIARAWDNQYPSAIITDGTGGAIIAWDNDPVNYSDIYAQRVDGAGIVRWTPNGIPVAMADGLQISPEIAVDERGGAIITWVDLRHTSQDDIYAQLVASDGGLGGPTDVLETIDHPLQSQLLQNFPNPFNPSTTIRYGLPYRSQVTVIVFDPLGRQVALLENVEQEAGYHEVKFDGSGLSSGVYFYRLQVRPLDSAIGLALPAGRRDSESGAGGFILTRKMLLLE